MLPRRQARRALHGRWEEMRRRSRMRRSSRRRGERFAVEAKSRGRQNGEAVWRWQWAFRGRRFIFESIRLFSNVRNDDFGGRVWGGEKLRTSARKCDRFKAGNRS